MPFKLGVLAISILASSIMIFYGLSSMESISDTQSYVSEQNQSDELIKRQSRLSSYDFRYVGEVSIQEALALIFNEASNSTPVILKGADNTVRVYGSTSNWRFAPTGSLGQLIDYQGNTYTLSGMSTDVGVVDRVVSVVPSYNTLYNILRGTSSTEPTYLINTDPDNSGEYSMILIVKR